MEICLSFVGVSPSPDTGQSYWIPSQVYFLPDSSESTRGYTSVLRPLLSPY